MSNLVELSLLYRADKYEFTRGVNNSFTLLSLFFLAALLRASSEAPWLTKFGKLSIRENLVMT